jgi:two-component system response regulator
MPKIILHVEDDENDVLLIQHALKKAGILEPVQVASDGHLAIDYFEGSGKFADRVKFPLPSLVLLDLKLPHVPGLDVLKWIRQQAGVLTPVVILSSSEHEDDIASAYKLGANAYLVKPSDSSRLAEMARSIKDFWLIQNTMPSDAKLSQASTQGSLTTTGA